MRNFDRRPSDIPVYTVVLNPKPIIPPPPPKPPKEIFPVPEEKPVEETVIVNEVAKSALKLEDAKKISFDGDIKGAVLFDGSQDVTLKATVKTSNRALKDGNGNNIGDTYAKITDLAGYASKADFTKKINYLETVLHATKEAVNESLRLQDLDFASAADIADMFGGE